MVRTTSLSLASVSFLFNESFVSNLFFSTINTNMFIHRLGLACMAVFLLIGGILIGSINMKIARDQALSVTNLNSGIETGIAITRYKDSSQYEEENSIVIVKHEER